MGSTKFVTQTERINNLSPKQKKDLEEFQEEERENNQYLLAETFNQLSYDKGNSYFHQKVAESELIDWEEHVKTLDKTKTQLIIEPNKYRFKDNKLTITKEQLPNLIILYACGLGLESAKINHDGLESLSLISNKLNNVELQTSNLNSLSLGDNEIEDIDISSLKKLEHLQINDNNLFSLDIYGLEKLKHLDCSNNQISSPYFKNYGFIYILSRKNIF